MRLTTLEQKVSDIIAPVIADLGIELLWVEYKSDVLGVFAENPETGKLTLEECTKISREISPLLEVEDPIDGAYRLEVSSAGIDRPLMKKEDYARYHDLEAKIEVEAPIDGQKRFRGFIRNTNDTQFTLDTDQGPIDLSYDEIYKAKLVMNDALIKETKKRFEVANQNGAEKEEVEILNN